MRLKSAALFLSVVIVNHPIAAQAQSASKVIERHINAIGGKKAVENIVSTDVSGRVSSADGRSGVFTERTQRPQLFSVSLSWGDARWRAGFNGRSAWQDDTIDGLRTLYGQAASRVRAEATDANARFMVPEKVSQFFVTGRDDVRGHPAIVLVAIASDGTTTRLFFDANSYLLVKDEQQTNAGVDERFFDDYRRVDQVMEPHRMEWRLSGETFRIAVERVTHNAPIGAQVFDVPVAPTAPLLDIDAVLSAAERNEQRAEGLHAPYVYTQTHASGRIDQGRVTPQERRTYEILHLGGRMVQKLLTRDGQTLSEVERRREDERVDAVVREVERQQQSGQPLRRAQEGSSGWGTRIRVPLLMAGDWLSASRRMSEYSNIRREQLRGRTAVVVDFQPKHGVTSNRDVERQIGAMAGTLWIDDASQHVIRIESYFRDDFDRTVRGSSMRVERTFVNGEVWLPSRIEVNRRLSWAFGKLSHWLDTEQYTDHKKFTVESKVTLPDPGH